MNYHQYYPVDIVNGPGTRCTLFVSGCVHECPGCYNKSTWRVNSGQPFTKAMEDQIINDLNDTRIKRQGISLSGGDPLHPSNRSGVRRLIAEIREKTPEKTIWLYTGDVWENVAGDPMMRQIDVLVDGEFCIEEYDPNLMWKGSKNQRVIDVRKSLMKGPGSDPVLHCGDYIEQER